MKINLVYQISTLLLKICSIQRGEFVIMKKFPSAENLIMRMVRKKTSQVLIKVIIHQSIFNMNRLNAGYLHLRMALEPKSGPGLPFWGFVTINFLQGWIVSPAPGPQPGGPGLRIYDPRRQGGPAIPPGTGYPF
jgi:hypothetical protein